MYRIRNFIFRLRRGISWFLFSFKQSPWQEDYQLFEQIEKSLLDTADYFEDKDVNTESHFDIKCDIEDMRLAAKLIRITIEGYYVSIYNNKQTDERSPTEDYGTANKKDERALQIAMNILAQRGFTWWL